MEKHCLQTVDNRFKQHPVKQPDDLKDAKQFQDNQVIEQLIEENEDELQQQTSDFRHLQFRQSLEEFITFHYAKDLEQLPNFMTKTSPTIIPTKDQWFEKYSQFLLKDYDSLLQKNKIDDQLEAGFKNVLTPNQFVQKQIASSTNKYADLFEFVIQKDNNIQSLNQIHNQIKKPQNSKQSNIFLQTHQVVFTQHFSSVTVQNIYKSANGKFLTFKVFVSLNEIFVHVYFDSEQKIGKYVEQKGQYVGSGAEGNVYRITGTRIIMKCIDLNIHYPEMIRNIIYEYGFNKLLSVVKIGPKLMKTFGFDLIFSPTRAYFSLEECQSLNCNEISVSKATKELKQSLRLLHKLQIIHYDIKPDNIMFSHYHQKYVFIDFGLAQNKNFSVGYMERESFRGTYHFCSQEMRNVFRKNPQYIDAYYNDTECLKNTLNNDLFVSRKYFDNQQEEYLNYGIKELSSQSINRNQSNAESDNLTIRQNQPLMQNQSEIIENESQIISRKLNYFAQRFDHVNNSCKYTSQNEQIQVIREQEENFKGSMNYLIVDDLLSNSKAFDSLQIELAYLIYNGDQASIQKLVSNKNQQVHDKIQTIMQIFMELLPWKTLTRQIYKKYFRSIAISHLIGKETGISSQFFLQSNKFRKNKFEIDLSPNNLLHQGFNSFHFSVQEQQFYKAYMSESQQVRQQTSSFFQFLTLKERQGRNLDYVQTVLFDKFQSTEVIKKPKKIKLNQKIKQRTDFRKRLFCLRVYYHYLIQLHRLLNKYEQNFTIIKISQYSISKRQNQSKTQPKTSETQTSNFMDQVLFSKLLSYQQPFNLCQQLIPHQQPILQPSLLPSLVQSYLNKTLEKLVLFKILNVSIARILSFFEKQSQFLQAQIHLRPEIVEKYAIEVFAFLKVVAFRLQMPLEIKDRIQEIDLRRTRNNLEYKVKSKYFDRIKHSVQILGQKYQTQLLVCYQSKRMLKMIRLANFCKKLCTSTLNRIPSNYIPPRLKSFLEFLKELSQNFVFILANKGETNVQILKKLAQLKKTFYLYNLSIKNYNEEKYYVAAGKDEQIIWGQLIGVENRVFMDLGRYDHIIKKSVEYIQAKEKQFLQNPTDSESCDDFYWIMMNVYDKLEYRGQKRVQDRVRKNKKVIKASNELKKQKEEQHQAKKNKNNDNTYVQNFVSQSCFTQQDALSQDNFPLYKQKYSVIYTSPSKQLHHILKKAFDINVQLEIHFEAFQQNLDKSFCSLCNNVRQSQSHMPEVNFVYLSSISKCPRNQQVDRVFENIDYVKYVTQKYVRWAEDEFSQILIQKLNSSYGFNSTEKLHQTLHVSRQQVLSHTTITLLSFLLIFQHKLQHSLGLDHLYRTLTTDSASSKLIYIIAHDNFQITDEKDKKIFTRGQNIKPMSQNKKQFVMFLLKHLMIIYEHEKMIVQRLVKVLEQNNIPLVPDETQLDFKKLSYQRLNERLLLKFRTVNFFIQKVIIRAQMQMLPIILKKQTSNVKNHQKQQLLKQQPFIIPQCPLTQQLFQNLKLPNNFLQDLTKKLEQQIYMLKNQFQAKQTNSTRFIKSSKINSKERNPQANMSPPKYHQQTQFASHLTIIPVISEQKPLVFLEQSIPFLKKQQVTQLIKKPLYYFRNYYSLLQQQISTRNIIQSVQIPRITSIKFLTLFRNTVLSKEFYNQSIQKLQFVINLMIFSLKKMKIHTSKSQIPSHQLQEQTQINTQFLKNGLQSISKQIISNNTSHFFIINPSGNQMFLILINKYIDNDQFNHLFELMYHISLVVSKYRILRLSRMFRNKILSQLIENLYNFQQLNDKTDNFEGLTDKKMFKLLLYLISPSKPLQNNQTLQTTFSPSSYLNLFQSNPQLILFYFEMIFSVVQKISAQIQSNKNKLSFTSDHQWLKLLFKYSQTLCRLLYRLMGHTNNLMMQTKQIINKKYSKYLFTFLSSISKLYNTIESQPHINFNELSQQSFLSQTLKANHINKKQLLLNILRQGSLKPIKKNKQQNQSFQTSISFKSMSLCQLKSNKTDQNQIFLSLIQQVQQKCYPTFSKTTIFSFKIQQKIYKLKCNTK